MQDNETFKVTSQIKKDKWNEFIQNHPKGNIFQTPEMMEVYKRTKRYEPVFLAVVDESDNVKAMLLAHVIREFEGLLGAFSARSIIQGGPLYVENEEGVAALQILTKHYDEIAKKKALYTEIRNCWDASSISNILNDMGYVYVDVLNFLINLNRAEEEIWRDIHKSRRKGINRAMKKGINIEEIHDKELIPIFYRIIEETYKKAKIPLADVSLFESAFELMVPKNMAKFYLAKYGDIHIGVRVVLSYKGLIYDWYAGALTKYLSMYVNELLVWQILKDGVKNGCRMFDFGGAGKPNEPYGPREFKRRFGGQLVNFGRYKKIHSPRKLWLAERGFEVWRRIK